MSNCSRKNLDEANEEWRPIDGFPGYFISSNAKASHNGKPLKPHEHNKYGHSVLRMYKDGKQYTKSLHRVVAEAFIPNPHNYPLVRHLDSNARNNEVSNLAWGTRADNAKDSIEAGTFSYHYHYFTPDEVAASNETNRTPVKAVNIKTSEEYLFHSQADAARKLGLSQGNIGRVLIGGRNHTGGYRFEYIEKGGPLDV